MALVQRQSEEPIDAWFCLGDLFLPSSRGGVQGDEKDGIDRLLAGQVLGRTWHEMASSHICVFEAAPTYVALRDHLHGLPSDALLDGFRCPQAPAPCKILEPTGMITLPGGLRVAFISGIDPTDAFPLSTVRDSSHN